MRGSRPYRRARIGAIAIGLGGALLLALGLRGAPPPPEHASVVFAALPMLPQRPPRVALVVADVGLARAPTEMALALPAGIALAVSPYASAPETLLARVAAAGHEPWLILPLEDAVDDAGPLALRVEAADREATAERAELLGLAQSTAGVALTAGRFAEAPAAAGALMADLRAAGLPVIEIGTPALAAVADAAGVGYASAGVPLDATLAPAALAAALAALEDRAWRGGVALGVVRAYPSSLDALAAWADGLAARGLQLVAPTDLLTVDVERVAGGPGQR